MQFSLGFLKNEIQNQKRKVEDDKNKRPAKFLKRGDLEKEEREKILQEREEKQKKQAEAERLKFEEMKKLYAVQTKKTEEIALPVEEVKKRLMKRREPITLFGEDDDARLQRLRELEHTDPMEYIEVKEFEGSDFLRKMEEEEYEEDVDVQKKKKEEEEDPDFKVSLRDPETSEEEILFFFQGVIRDMRLVLDRRSEVDKKSARGRQETIIHQQTRVFVRPFFQKLQKQIAPSEIVTKVLQIVKCLKNMNYIGANDAYYRMAIGNAAWPMGVTNVGIHERTSREKISNAEIAHVLNDDTQRKYIQAIKRMMTFVQSQNPQVPSKSVN